MDRRLDWREEGEVGVSSFCSDGNRGDVVVAMADGDQDVGGVEATFNLVREENLGFSLRVVDDFNIEPRSIFTKSRPKCFDDCLFRRKTGSIMGRRVVVFSAILLLPFWGRITLAYTRRLYAHSFPENVNFFTIGYMLPFSLF